MDPKACLERAADALKDGDLAECRYALDDYEEWVRKGGYCDEGMNETYSVISEELRHAQEQ